MATTITIGWKGAGSAQARAGAAHSHEPMNVERLADVAIPPIHS